MFASLPIPRWAIALLLTFVCAGVFALRGQPMSRLELMTRNQLAASPNAQYPDVTTAEAALWLKQQLAAVRLNQIKVNESDGQLHLQGRYEPAQKSLWVHVQQAFDRRFGQQLVLRADVVPSAEIAKPRVRFQAVWFGAHPYVVNESGKRLYPGASLADDWTLERIENNEVILARGEERFTFTL
ncbi:Inner membrane component of T3SS [Pseudomonas sp. NFR09]|nr:Inner membrane component of T3SS [Pseudomonas sp. NFR09]